ncbi:hypothetical protein [Bosea sp. PAMC 26642]|uniref:hypothetical protein n=1 Tax=Bosea sp. (strain PAMC 26642) TaxID=1792307 RepID=UPI0007705386|nr:hypothetical protein [Bosea sp. PAMC 26642]AMJ63253.1 hypothetical protein AXW83_25745 [Bosea sp. PAMC 26642]
MTEFPWAAVVTGASTITGTLGAVVLTMWLTGRRTMRERLWDIRREAYGEIISALTETLAHTDEIIHVIDHVDPRHWPAEAVSASVGRWNEHAAAARRHVAKNRVVLAADFLRVYDAFGVKMKELDADTTIRQERFQAARDLIDETRRELERLARRALRSEET